MSEAEMSPDEAALRRDLRDPAFRIGVRKKRWRLVRLDFPYAYFEIAAGQRNPGPSQFLLKVECRGYSATAPTSQLWDARTDTALIEDLKPKNPQGGTVIAFTSSCGPCLYHPIDRLARDHWPNQFDDMAWCPDSTITTLLETVHALVHQSDYQRSAAPDAAAVMPSEPLGLAAE